MHPTFFSYSYGIKRPSVLIFALFTGALMMMVMGCRTSPPPDPGVQHTVKVTSLPMPEEDPEGAEIQLTVMMLVMPNGTVREAHIRSGHLDENWNRSVVDSLLTWRFSEITGGNPDGRWHQRKVKVQMEETLKLDLAIYRSDTREIADSLQRVLARVNDFEAFFADFTPHESDQFNVTVVREQDISVYPEVIRRELRILRSSRPSRPLYQDGGYVIFFKIGDPHAAPTHRPPPAI
jgi:hypothetical protein